MATATSKAQASKRTALRGHDTHEAPAVEFAVYRDNGGSYHWEIVDAAGESLGHSERFSSRDEAERAARYVYDGVKSAHFRPDMHAEGMAVPT
jgi:uncharacterized protein YegP (UPF0339 family)